MVRGGRWRIVERLAEKTGVPALPMMSPRGVNDPWLHEAANCLAEADVVLLAGKKLDFSLRFGGSPPFAEGCRFIQIDADEDQLRDDERVELKVHADPVAVLTQLIDGFDGAASHLAWRERVRSARQTVPETWAALRKENTQPIHPLRVCQAVQPYLDDGAMFVSDGGEFGQWVQAGLDASTRLINGPSGAIGSAIPMAVGAKKVDTTRSVFAFVGDGTFGYHGMELDTAVRYDLPIVVIVGNDARWNAEHQLQINTYGPDRTVGCELLLSRYDRVAEALGGYGVFVEDLEELDAAVEQAVQSGLPACVNVATKPVGAPTLLR
jgi:acetolactate synthase-1/2/3 large subunit